MAFEQIGLEAVLEGVSDFIRGGEDVNGAMASMGDAVGFAAEAFGAAGDFIVDAVMGFASVAIDMALEAGAALVDFFADSFAGALEAEQTLARLGQVIESTGGIAGVTVGEAEALADEFKHLAGGSDDAVLSIVDMGLRMGTISEDEMPAFIQSTLDLAAVMGDASKASMIMARAQEDPVGTLGALRKAGILVNETTEAQIKSMVAAGDTAGAYSLLMDRVGEATAGAAETMASTTAGQWAIFTETIADAGESIVGAFLPGLMSIAGPLLETVVPAISEFATSVANVITLLTTGDFSGGIFGLQEDDPLIDFLFNVREGLISIGEFVTTNLPLMQETFTTVWGSVQEVMGTVGAFITDTLIPAIENILGTTGTELPTAQETFESVMSAISTAVTGVAAFIKDPLIPAITQVVDWIVEHWPEIKAKTEEVWNAVESTITTVINTVSEIVSTVLEGIKGFWEEHGDSIMVIVDTFIENAKKTIDDTIHTIQTVIETVLGLIKTFWDTWGDDIEQIVTNVTEGIGGIIDGFAAALQGDWEGFGEGLRVAWDETWDNIKLIIDGAIEAIKEVDWAAVGTAIIEGIANGITNAVGFLQDAAMDAANAALEAAKGFLGISSPSKIAAEEIGKPFGEGIAFGMGKSVQDIVKAADNIVDKMLDRTKKRRGGGGLCEFAEKAADEFSRCVLPKPVAGKRTPVEIGFDELGKSVIDASKKFTETFGMGLMTGGLVSKGSSTMPITPFGGGFTPGNTYNYSPIYGTTPVSPERDFALMQVFAPG